MKNLYRTHWEIFSEPGRAKQAQFISANLKTWHEPWQSLQHPHSSTQTLQIIELRHKTFWSSEEKNEELPVKLHSLHVTHCEAWTQVHHLMSTAAICIDWLCWYPYFFKNSLKTLKTFCSEFKSQKIETFLFLSQKSRLRLRWWSFPKTTERKTSILQLS